MFPFTDHFSWSLPMFANNFRNMYSSIMFPSLPVSILYETSNNIFPACVCNLAIMLDHFLFTYTELILTISVSSSCDSASMSISTSWTTWLLLLLHTFLKCPVLLHAAHVFPYTGQCLGAWLCLQYLHSHLQCVATCASLPQVLFDSVPFFYLSNIFISVRSFNTAACALCALTLLAHACTSSLVICTLLVLDISSLIILSNMILSFSP